MTRRQRQIRRRQRAGKGVQRGFMVMLGTLVVVAFLSALTIVGYIVGITATAPGIDSLRPIDKGATSAVYASNGKRLGFIQNDELRTPVPSGELPRVLKQATVAIEDERYFHHRGVDYEGVVRAAIKNIKSGRTVQGGSTITMQLVRALYIEHPQRNFQRKIREAKLAEELENEHSKDWILTSYINSVPYGTVGGQTAVGAQAAARVFFDKRVDQLNLPQAALLAGLPQAPSIYNPFRDPAAALSRRNQVLAQMVRLHMISPADAIRASRARLGVKHNSYYTARRENYFFDYVKEQLIERYGISTVRKGGLKIYTTIDLAKQEQARQAMTSYLGADGDPASAIVSIDPRNGYIRAMASTSSYGRNQFNYAAQGRRQAGSTFKVMVLMAALRQGMDPNSTTYVSRPLDLSTKYGPWKVQTYSHTYLGRVNLVEATAKSDNTVYAQLDLDVGPDAVREAAYDLGIKTHLEGLPAEGLGGLRLGVSPLEMANAFATISSEGIRHDPIAVKRIVFADGKSENLGRPKGTRTFSRGTSYEAIKVLQQVVQRGTGTSANIGCPMAGKTGTVDDYTDAWFVGFTPHLATSVWVGHPNAKIPMWGMTGGSTPAGIWHDYMTQAIGNDCPDFKVPPRHAKLSPGFGRYAQTGTSSDRDYSYRGYGSGGGYSGGGYSGGGGYSSRYYESPPQRIGNSSQSSGGGYSGGGSGGDGGGDSGGGDSGGGDSGGATGGASAPG
jgi:penicillin-binding protein 1A